MEGFDWWGLNRLFGDECMGLERFVTGIKPVEKPKESEKPKKIKGKENIEYATKSWAPMTGCEPFDCAVDERLRNSGGCWARKMANRMKGRFGYEEEEPFQITWHGDRIVKMGKREVRLIDKPLHWTNQRVATCFMGDLGCAPTHWQIEVLNVIRKSEKNFFFILTKQPHGLMGLGFPDNCLVGVTINLSRDLYRVYLLNQLNAKFKFVSLEPIYENIFKEIQIITEDKWLKQLAGLCWFIIGAQTNPEFQPKQSWVQRIEEIAKYLVIPVFMKDNLKYDNMQYDFPLFMEKSL